MRDGVPTSRMLIFQSPHWVLRNSKSTNKTIPIPRENMEIATTTLVEMPLLYKICEQPTLKSKEIATTTLVKM